MSEVVQKMTVDCPYCGRCFHVPLGSHGKTGRCPGGHEFIIPAVSSSRAESEAIPAPASRPILAEVAEPAEVACRNHPGMPATIACKRCGAMICRTCDFPMPDGSHLCPSCAAQGGGDDALGPMADPFASPGVCCQVHPEVQAVARCHNCHGAMCSTCDFAVAPGIHLCVTCATAPPKLSGSRKAMLIWSMVMATWVTVMVVLLLSQALASLCRDEAGQTLVGWAIMLPALIGLALSMASMDRRAGNPPIVWGAVVWNCILTVVWIALTVVGLTMR